MKTVLGQRGEAGRKNQGRGGRSQKVTDGVKNILFLVADQWRGDTLGALGHPCVPTPNLDRLAREGVLFRQHYCQTSPCGPSRASMLTGLYMFNHRQVINGTPLDGSLPNLAHLFRKEGYEPALFGFTDTPLDPRREPGQLDRDSMDWVCPGFDPVAPFLIADNFSGWRANLVAAGYQPPENARAMYLPEGGMNSDLWQAPSPFAAEHSDTAWLTDEALKYIAERGDRPWFVHWCCLRPHPPLVAPEPYNRLIDPDAVPLPAKPTAIEAIREQHPFMAWSIDTQNLTEYFREPVAPGDVTELQERRMRTAYYGNCAEIDANIGRMLDQLEASGELDRTLIIFCSDHGDQFGDNWLYGRRGYFDGHFHVPLIVRDPSPDAVRGAVVDAFTEMVDLLPTLLEAKGAPPIEWCDGRSLMPFLRGETPADWRDAVHFEFDFRNPASLEAERAFGLPSDQCAFAAIRDDHYKLVQFAALPPVFFDLEEDPMETWNLAQDPDQAEHVRDLMGRMIQWRMRHERKGLTDYFQPLGGSMKRFSPAAF